MRMHEWKRALVAVWMVAGTLFVEDAVAAAPPAAVAMVSDLQGKGTLVKGSARAPLALLADLETGTQVELEPNARMVALYLDGSGEYALQGPAMVVIDNAAPRVVKGAPAQKRNVLGGKANVRIKPVGVVQGAIVMRSTAASRSRIRLVSPGGTRTLDARPEFRWSDDQPARTYRFELTDDSGRTLHESEVQGTAVALPPGVALKEGIKYTWSVSSRSPDGRKATSVADFEIAPAALRRDADTLRPAARAPFSERVAYAAWLEHAELKDEARKQWKALATERPGDSRLESLARE